ncbi:hypothetical protein ES708_23881 [subsurface metagenome]
MEKIIFSILTVAVTAISPELRKVLVNIFHSLNAAAKATDNKFDDLLVAILGALLDVSE